MPVLDQTTTNSYTGNGVSTVFAYTFKLLDQGDLLVEIDGVTQTLTTHYSVSGVGTSGGGNVTFVTAPESGAAVDISRDMAFARDTDYQENGDLQAETLDEDIDRVVMLAQQVRDQNNAGSYNFIQAGSGATTRTVQSKLRDVVSVNDFGALGDGVADDTTAITNAITAAKAGSGSVFFPKGKYRVTTGGIAVAGVTLIGCGTPEWGNTYDDNGSVILLDSLTTSPFVLGLGWNITGLTFHYPDQTGADATPIVYPALFSGTYVAGGVMNNVTVTNAYVVFKFSVGTAVGDFRLNQCRMYGIDKVFWFLEGAPEVINVSDSIFSFGIWTPAMTPNTHCRDYTASSGEFCRIDVSGGAHTSVDGFDLSNSIVFGYRYGIRVMSGTLNVSTINDNWFDATRTALSVEGTATIANTRWSGNYHWSSLHSGVTTSKDSVIYLSSTSAASNLNITGNDFVYSLGNHIYWNSAATNDIHIAGNRFKNWGKTTDTTPASYYAISATDSGMNGSIQSNKIHAGTAGDAGNNVSGIGIGGTADVAIQGNEFDACYLPVWIIAATKAKMTGNASSGTTYTSSVKNDAAAGVLVSDGNLWDKGTVGPSGKPMFYATAGTQTFTGAKTQITFGTEVTDRDANFASSTFTAPTTDDYEFTVQLNNTTGVTVADVWTLTLEQAGGGSVVFSSSVYVPANTAAAAPLRVTGRMSLTAADTVKAYLTRSSGSGNYVSINDANFNNFTGRRI